MALGIAMALAGCRREEPSAADPQLLGQVKSALAERERRLQSFHLEGAVREAGQEAPFETFFRAPNRVRAELRSGEGRVLSFDGKTLYELDRGKRTLVTYDVGAERAEAAVVLNQVLGAFVPEGYRVPVVDLRSAKASRGPHPRGPEAVTLTQRTVDEGGAAIELAYVLRWPAMDLLEKRLTAYGQTKVVTAGEEHCDGRLKLCVPKVLSETVGGSPGAQTALTRVELDAAIPADSFTLTAPEGFTTRKQALAPAR